MTPSHHRSLTPVDHDAAPTNQDKPSANPHDQAIELNASGTTLQYGNITPAASPVLGHMLPPPRPQSALEVQLEGHKRPASTELSHRPTKIVRLPLGAPVQQRGVSLAASHPASYDTRARGPSAVNIAAVAQAPPQRSSPPQARLVDFPHSIVDPGCNTHCTANGPPLWPKPCAVNKCDYDRTSYFVISPVAVIGLPFGSTIEHAATYL